MGEHSRPAEGHLRHVFAEAETAARKAGDALLEGLPTGHEQVRSAVSILIEYCRRCRDPFHALDIARVMRALMDDLDSAAYSKGPLSEWARAEIRLQSMASRIARLLRDQNELPVEQALVDVAILHLWTLEGNPQYPRILGEMSRITDSAAPSHPVALVEEFFSLARRDFALPTRPPEQD